MTNYVSVSDFGQLIRIGGTTGTPPTPGEITMAIIKPKGKSWDPWEDKAHTPVYVSTTSFKIEGQDVTGDYVVDRRVEFTDGGTITRGTISSATFSTDTTVSVVMDNSVNLTAGISKVRLGFHKPTDSGIVTFYPSVPGETGVTNFSYPVGNVLRYGADRTGTTESTSAIQAAIDSAIAADVAVLAPAGTYLVGKIDLNGTGHATPADDQYTAPLAFFGEGRRATIFKAKSGEFSAGEYVLTCNNASGIHIGNFGVDGDSIADSGIDLSWTGGSGGNPAVAPSNQNVIENVFVEGCTANSINLDQCHDSRIDGLWVRDATAGNTAVSINGGGGQLVMSNSWVSSGVIDISCQNFSATNCGFFGGIKLSGSGYNKMAFTGCHIYADTSTGYLINSTAGLGTNATRGVSWVGCYFNSGGTHVIAGKFWQGMDFKSCQFNGYSSAFFATITPQAGAGSPPLFTFEHCSFESTTPANVASQANVVLMGCRDSGGSTIDLRFGVDVDPLSDSAQNIGSDTLRWANITAEKMTIVGDSGNNSILVMDDNQTNAGARTVAEIQSGAAAYNSGMWEAYINHTTDDWIEHKFWVHGGGKLSNPHIWLRNTQGNTPSGGVASIEVSANIIPRVGDTYDLGNGATYDFQDAYLLNGATTTSDKRRKQQKRTIDNAERRVAQALKTTLCCFKMNSEVEKVGDADAQWHSGVMAQDVVDVFAAEGLDAHRYGIINKTEWEDMLDADGNVLKEAGYSYGIRYDRLFAFMLMAM